MAIIPVKFRLWDGNDTAALIGNRTYNSIDEEMHLKAVYQTLVAAEAALVNYYKMDEASWNGTANEVVDSEPTSPAHGTATGATTTADELIGTHAGIFDGNDYVSFGSQVLPLGAKTIEFWIKTSATTGTVLDNCGGSSSNHGTYVGLTAGKIYILSEKGTPGSPRFSVTCATAINNNTPRQIAITWDGTTNANGVKIYVDHVLDVQGTALTTETINATYNLMFGDANGGGAGFVGVLDEIAFYNDDLTGAQITAHEPYSALSPSPVAVYEALPLNSVVKWSTFRVPELMNTGDAGSVEYELTTNGGAAQTWRTQAQVKALSDLTITDATNSVKIRPRYNSDGHQKATSQAFAIIDVDIPTASNIYCLID